MAEEKKPSFVDMLKKSRPTAPAPSSEGSGHAARFTPGRTAPTSTKEAVTQSNNQSEASSNSSASTGGSTFSDKFTPKKANETPLQEQGSVKRSRIAENSYAQGVKGLHKIYWVRGKDRGRAAWHCVKVPKNIEQMFLAKARSGSIDVADYGEVLHSGWGENPPDDLKKRIEEEYN